MANFQLAAVLLLACSTLVAHSSSACPTVTWNTTVSATCVTLSVDLETITFNQCATGSKCSFWFFKQWFDGDRLQHDSQAITGESMSLCQTPAQLAAYAQQPAFTIDKMNPFDDAASYDRIYGSGDQELLSSICAKAGDNACGAAGLPTSAKLPQPCNTNLDCTNDLRGTTCNCALDGNLYCGLNHGDPVLCDLVNALCAVYNGGTPDKAAIMKLHKATTLYPKLVGRNVAQMEEFFYESSIAKILEDKGLLISSQASGLAVWLPALFTLGYLMI